MHEKVHIYSTKNTDFHITHIRVLFFNYCHRLWARRLGIEPSGKINLAFTRTLVKIMCPLAIQLHENIYCNKII